MYFSQYGTDFFLSFNSTFFIETDIAWHEVRHAHDSFSLRFCCLGQFELFALGFLLGSEIRPLLYGYPGQVGDETLLPLLPLLLLPWLPHQQGAPHAGQQAVPSRTRQFTSVVYWLRQLSPELRQ